MITLRTGKLKAFLHKANSVAGGGFLAISDYLLIESNPKFNEIIITKTSDGATIQETLHVVAETKERFIVDVRALSVIIANGETVEIRKIGKNIILKCGNSTTTVAMPDDEDYLSLIENTATSAAHLLNNELLTEIGKCAAIASVLSHQFDPRYNNIHVQEKDNRIEIMGTCGSGMYISRVDGGIEQLLIPKKVCEAICKHPSIELVSFGNKLCFADGDTAYAFNKTEQSFLSAYESILSHHEEEHNTQAIFNKDILVAFCAQVSKILNNKNVPITLTVKNGKCSLVSENTFLSTHIESELHGEFKDDISVMFSSETITTVLNAFEDVVKVSFHEKSMSIKGENDNAIGIVYLLTNQS